MKTAGVVFDFYDDVGGTILSKLFPTQDDVPEIVKQAHILNPEEREVLRDEAYALVMKNEGTTLRKFACVDAGNTLLSTLYFLENSERFPEEAVKVAQANLESFCEDFGLDFEKIATLLKRKPVTGMSRTRDPNKQPVVGDEADWVSRTNLISQTGSGDTGKVMATASAVKTASKHKQDFLMGHHKLNPNAKQPKKHSKDHEKHDFLMGHHKLNPNAKQPKQKHASIVDVSGREPGTKFEKKASRLTALGEKYSLDSMTDVQTAINYFSDYVYEMKPADRHEFAVKTAARAEELGLQVPELMQRYGATDYALDVDSHLANRRAVAPTHKPVWDALQEKRASINPLTFAQLLSEADKTAGLNHYYGGEVQDPYYATFGPGWATKTASGEDWAWENGVVSVNAEQLRSLADQRERLAEKFDDYLVDGFSKDPIAIFDSLPAHHKAILAGMANSGDENASSDI